MNQFILRLALACAIAMIASRSLTAQGLHVPVGFDVVEFADSTLANDIHVMTVDPKGRVVVAGRGYIRILIDDNGDGKADRAIDFAPGPKDGAMGLLWERDTLFVMGDGGLRRFTSKDGEKADGPSELIRAMKTGGEHASHAIRRGPDGWLYVIGGNNAGIDRSYAELPASPITDPIAGCVLRFQPDLKKCEIVAHGFRNPYGFDFNLDGDLFTFDSDNERCVSLPWSEPTRFYHVIEGRHYGWLNPQYAVAWRRPPYFCDIVAPIATLGRGSPTGVACYAHNQFPPEYHGGFFLCDWTFGKVHFASLEKKGATYSAKTRAFLESRGDNGFAPTACAVDPKTGDLYISIGGRGTRGAVYRVRHAERFAKLKGQRAPLPMARRSLDWNDALRKEYEVKIASKSSADQLRALQIARRQKCFLGDTDITSPFENRYYFDDLAVRQAQGDLMHDLVRMVPSRHADALKAAIRKNDELQQAISSGLGIARSDRAIALNRGLFVVLRSKFAERKLEGIRLVQLGLGDIGSPKTLGTIWEGYSSRLGVTDAHTAKLLTPLFPTKHSLLDRELARTLGMLGHSDDGLRLRVLGECGDNPVDAIHYLACYAGLPGKRDSKETAIVADTLLDIDRRIVERKLNRDSNWAPRMRELYLGLAERDAELPRAIVSHAAFGRPDHGLFANTAGFPRVEAARMFFARWQRDADYALTADVIQLLDALPTDVVVPVVRKRWGRTGHDLHLLPLLAKQPIPDDRSRFIGGLASPQATTISACLEGLNKLGAKSDAAEAFALIASLQRTTDKQTILRKSIVDRLEKATAQSLGSDPNRWVAWLEKEHPEYGRRLENPDGVDVAKWNQRSKAIDWNTGQADLGKAVFAKASCAQCHSGSQSLGPDLLGVAKRFSRDDLMTAILQPSKDVAARYQMTVVESKDGKSYQGIVIYDAVDSLILQTPQTTVRLDGANVASRHVSRQSLMPAGLLDALSDRDIADLVAYLRSR
ncbi:MAG: c-type cytochrome [Planctomycetes bacterium]|nr:c-type cytochrome [Planctomycetota bacterium]